MVPLPRLATWDHFNAWLEEQCRKRQAEILRGHSETIGERLQRDLESMAPLPPSPLKACDQATGWVGSQALVRYKTNDYSVPVAYGHRDVCIRAYVDRVVIGCGGAVIARHARATTARKWSSIRSTTCRSSRRRSAPSTRRRPWRAGSCRPSSRPCAG